jgi:hypothetical protein
VAASSLVRLSETAAVEIGALADVGPKRLQAQYRPKQVYV